jgi:hypothetical protein
MNKVELGNDLELLLLDLTKIARKYNMKNFKGIISDTLRVIIDQSYDLIHLNFQSNELIGKLQKIDKGIVTLNGKMGYNDYERFKEISEELGVHIVALTLKNA